MSQMTAREKTPRWIERLNSIQTPVEKIHLPDVKGKSLSQDKEYCEVVINGQVEQFRFHNYHEIYKVPGLYEKLFYEHLKCCSPSRVSSLLEDVISEFGGNLNELKILDIGAGNGMVADELAARGVDTIVGIDIVQEAKKAAFRDRPKLYDDYYVADLTDLHERDKMKIRRKNLNCLTCVAALGFGDIPTSAFIEAIDLITTPGWMAFNIKEIFLQEKDSTGFNRMIHDLRQEKVIQIQVFWRYRHRLSVSGKPLYYVAVIANKIKNPPDNIIKKWRM